MHNPYPSNTLYINIYRLTNNSDIGIYFEKSKKQDGEAAVKKSFFLPKGYKERIHDFIPGEWKENVSVPIET